MYYTSTHLPDSGGQLLITSLTHNKKIIASSSTVIVLYNVKLGQRILLFILLEGLTIAIMECTLVVLTCTVIVLMLGSINRITFEISLTQLNVYFVNEKKVVGVFLFRSSSSNRELFCSWSFLINSYASNLYCTNDNK